MHRKNRLIEVVLCGACFLSCFSQLPYFVTNGMTQRICFPLWIICFFLLLLNSRWTVDKSILKIIVPACVVLALVMVNSILNGENDYISSSLLYSFIISIFIFLIGNFAGEYCSKELIDKLFICYIIGTFIVSISVFVQYFGFYYSFSTSVYAYPSKNSFAQIIFTAVVLLIIRIKPTKKFLFVVKWLVVLFEILLLVYLRSRASLIGFITVIMILTLSKNTRRSIRLMILGAGTALIVLMLTNASINHMIFYDIIFAGRDVSNLDSISSGRVTILTQFPDLIKGNWLFGMGATYYECFPLSAILQFGLPAGIIMIYISVIPLIQSVKNSRISEFWYILMLVSVGYVIDSLFEGLTPFGAGTKCFFMWLLFGMLVSYRTVLNEELEEYA